MKKKRTFKGRVNRFVLIVLAVLYIIGIYVTSVQQTVEQAVPNPFAYG